LEFLLRHYEKMLLGCVLLFLLASIFLVMGQFGKVQEELSQASQQAESKAAGGALLEPLDQTVFNAQRNLTDPRKILSVQAQSKDERRGALFEPNRYIKCNNQNCQYLILLASDICPFCGDKQPDMGKDAAEGDDSDNDGMPDLYEQRYEFLNPYDPSDATQDYDNDGFFNVEEYRHGTKPDDPDSFPALGHLLRVVRVLRRPLPLVLRNVDEGRSEDKTKWDVSVSVWDNARRRNVNRNVRIGDKINDFEVRDIIRQGTGAAAVYQIDISQTGAAEDTYRLEQGKTELSRIVTVQMIYLASRRREDAPTVMRRSVLVRNVGEEFPLSKRKSTGQLVEYYRLKTADDASMEVVVEQLEQAKGKAVAEIVVPRFNPAADFTTATAGHDMRGDGGMEGPGDDFMP